MTDISNPPGFRGRIYDSITDTIGATPLVRLNKLAANAGCVATILGKCEFFNPLSSVKDRIGISMIEAAEKEGRLKPGVTIIEPTSGNTGIALAFIAASRGYQLILCMPESMSIERRKMLALLGAKLELTPAARGMNGAVKRAEELAAELPNAIILQQFNNPANPIAHIQTADEIWTDSQGMVVVVICGVGTGGTITGIGRVLRERKPDIKMIAVEPEDSPVLSGGVPGPHKIQGIGAGFVPAILDRSVISEILQIGNETAFTTARLVASLEGLPVGISSGAALAAALEVGQRPEMAGKTIVAILPSCAERYLSTQLFDGL